MDEEPDELAELRAVCKTQAIRIMELERRCSRQEVRLKEGGPSTEEGNEV